MTRLAAPGWLVPLAALGPVALGIATHREHVEAVEACSTVAAPEHATEIVAIAVPLPAVAPSEAAPAVPPRAVRSFGFVVRIGDRPHVVLANDPRDAWLDPTERRTVDDEGGRIGAPAALDRLPVELADASTQPWVFHADDGRRCVGELGAPSIVAEAQFEYGDPERSPHEAVWAEGRRLLVAPLERSLACDRGMGPGEVRWARLARSTEPVIHRRVSAPAHAERQAATAFLATPSLLELAAQRRGGEEPWASRRLSEDLVAQAWASGAGPMLFDLRMDGQDFGGCGGLVPTLGLVVGSHEPFLPDDHGESHVAAVFDLDADGALEVLLESGGRQTLVEIDGRGRGSVVDEIAAIPFDGCSC